MFDVLIFCGLPESPLGWHAQQHCSLRWRDTSEERETILYVLFGSSTSALSSSEQQEVAPGRGRRETSLCHWWWINWHSFETGWRVASVGYLSRVSPSYTFMSAAHESFGKLNSDNFDFGTKRLPKTPSEERSKEMNKMSKKKDLERAWNLKPLTTLIWLVRATHFLNCPFHFWKILVQYFHHPGSLIQHPHCHMIPWCQVYLQYCRLIPVPLYHNLATELCHLHLSSSTPVSHRSMSSAAAASLPQPDNIDLSSTPVISSCSTLVSHQPMPSAAAAKSTTRGSIMKQHGLQFNPGFLRSENASLNERGKMIHIAIYMWNSQIITNENYSIFAYTLWWI